MPEIAEVRIMANNIAHIVGKRFTGIEIMENSRYKTKPPQKYGDFIADIADNDIRVLSINTKGKFLWIETDNIWTIWITFGMSGNFRPEPSADFLEKYNEKKQEKSPPKNRITSRKIDRDEFLKHASIKFIFDSDSNPNLNSASNSEGYVFYFHDIRRFGTIKFSNSRKELDKKLQSIGHDMLTPIEDREFVRLMRGRNGANICVALMDQKTVAGVGNYIKAESLYRAKIHPFATIQNLLDSDLVALKQAIVNVAEEAVREGGASLYTWTGFSGDQSKYKEKLSVYGCSRDPFGNKVVVIPEKSSPDKRSTYWIPEIQVRGLPVSDENVVLKRRIIRRRKIEL